MPRSNSVKVFVVNNSGHDFTQAEKFSDYPLVFLSHGHVPFTERTAFEMALALRDFHEEDFLLLSGSAALAAMAVSILKETFEMGTINVLVYRAYDNTYLPRKIGWKIHLPPA